MRRSTRFLYNACILCAASLTMRVLSIRFNAWMVARIGPAGMGLYQLISSVFAPAVTLACSGIHMAATRLVAEEAARGSGRGMRAAMSRCIAYALCFGWAAWALLYFGAGFLGTVWIGDSRTVSALRILACSLPCIAPASALRGYFTAVRRISRNSAADIAEQLVQMGLAAMLLTHILPPGLESACTALALGCAASEILGCISLGILHAADSRRHMPSGGEAPAPILPRLLRISLPVAGSAYLRSGLGSVNQFLIPSSLQRSGMPQEDALAAYGAVHSMVMPVLQLPEMFLGAFASLLIPEFTEMHIRGDSCAISRALHAAMQLTLLFAIGAMGFFSAFAELLTAALYRTADAGRLMILLAPLVPLMYADRIVDAALTGLHQQANSVLYNLLESMAASILTMVLVPRMGMTGYAAVLLTGKGINLLLSLSRLIRVTGMRFSFVRWFLIPLAAAGIGCTAFRLGQDILHLSPALSVAGYWLLYGAMTSAAGCLGRGRDSLLRMFLHALPKKQKTAAAVRCGSHRADTDTRPFAYAIHRIPEQRWHGIPAGARSRSAFRPPPRRQVPRPPGADRRG